MRKLKNEELGRLDIEGFKGARKFPIALVLDNVRSMHNVGSAFRTGDAFRVEEIILTGITARPPHREINKAALGATESVNWKYFESNVEAIEYLKGGGYRVVAIEQADEATPLNKLRPERDRKLAFVFGNEVFGVSDDVINASEQCIEIPQFGTKHSLNIAVSIGVVCWDYCSKMGFLEGQSHG